MKNLSILVTGGAGYIGSHTVVELLVAGHDVFIIDNLSNCDASVLDRIERITGRRPGFAKIDVRDHLALRTVFESHAFDAVIHFAGLKAAGESVVKPLAYFDNNVCGGLAIIEAMIEAKVKTLVFSSSATVYGDPPSVPIREDFPLQPANPYGRSKLMMEDALRDIAAADPGWRMAILRYFNPIGAHPSGLIGEAPHGTPNNLMPYLAEVAMKTLPEVLIFGNDYPTTDGTGVRDYIHVVDLATGHLAALRALTQQPGILTVNLGTGQGCSVLEMVRAFSHACGREIPFRTVKRRPGDVAQSYADPSLANETLGWKATRGIDEMCADTWRWQNNKLVD